MARKEFSLISVGVLGANGFVGKALVRALFGNQKFEIFQITRDSSLLDLPNRMDFVIHSANPAKRFQANSAPNKDLLETVAKTVRFLDFFSESKLVLVSSISCRTQLETPYGLNRKICEDLATASGASVVRLGPMFGTDRNQDVLHDILNSRNVFVARETKYAYCNVDWVADYVCSNLARLPELVEIGAKNIISLSEIAQRVSSDSKFEGPVDDQFPINGFDGPDVNEIFKFIEERRFLEN